MGNDEEEEEEDKQLGIVAEHEWSLFWFIKVSQVMVMVEMSCHDLFL